MRQFLFNLAWGAAGSPLFAVLVTVGGVWAGAWASLYAAEILDAFPFRMPWPPSDWEMRPKAAIFWAALLITAIMVFFRTWATDAARRAATDELVTAMRTNPPTTFLNTWADLTADAVARLLLARDAKSATKADVEGLIRQQLYVFSVLLREMYGEASDRVYGANIMVYLSKDGMDEATRKQIHERLKFFETDETLAKLRGVLDLQPSLSTTATPSRENKITEDTALDPLALPIPEETRVSVAGDTGQRWLVVPGAPLAFVSRTSETVSNVEEIPRWCQQKGDFPRRVIDQMREHFRTLPGSHSRAFISVPLVDSSGEPCAVLNIHHNRADVFDEESKVTQLLLLLTPHLKITEQLLAIWARLPVVADDEPGA